MRRFRWGFFFTTLPAVVAFVAGLYIISRMTGAVLDGKLTIEESIVALAFATLIANVLQVTTMFYAHIGSAASESAEWRERDRRAARQLTQHAELLAETDAPRATVFATAALTYAVLGARGLAPDDEPPPKQR